MAAMTLAEIDQWTAMLGPTSIQRLAVIADLLRHANEDRMSSEDRRICRLAQDRVLKRIRTRLLGRLMPVPSHEGQRRAYA